MKIRNRIVSLVLAMVLLVSAIPMSAFAAGNIMYGIGYITGSKVRLRSEANTDSKIVDTTGKGEVVTVISKSGDWYNVIYDLKEGYIHSDYLDVSTTANAELGYGKINGSGVNMRSGAGTSYSKVVKGNKGDKAYIVGISDGWYRVIYSNKVCYIRSDYLDLTEVPYENNASKHSPKFFRGGKSTGTEVSAAALNGSTGSSSSTAGGFAGSQREPGQPGKPCAAIAFPGPVYGPAHTQAFMCISSKRGNNAEGRRFVRS